MSDKSIKTIWKLKDTSIAKVDTLVPNYKLKHGMFAGIPIICKKDKCPYKESCYLPEAHREEGERCPVEIAAIISRFDSWCKHFEIESSGDYIDDADLVDATLIRDLVDIEVQILRAENRIAINGDFIGSTISTIDNKGKAYYEETVTPEAEFKLGLLEKRYKVLQLLNSTRKDKRETLNNNNMSDEAMGIFKEINEKMEQLKNIDLDNISFEDTREGEVNEI